MIFEITANPDRALQYKWCATMLTQSCCVATAADAHSEQEKINYVLTGREGGLTTLERLMGSTRLYWAIWTGTRWSAWMICFRKYMISWGS